MTEETAPICFMPAKASVSRSPAASHARRRFVAMDIVEPPPRVLRMKPRRTPRRAAIASDCKPSYGKAPELRLRPPRQRHGPIPHKNPSPARSPPRRRENAPASVSKSSHMDVPKDELPRRAQFTSSTRENRGMRPALPPSVTPICAPPAKLGGGQAVVAVAVQIAGGGRPPGHIFVPRPRVGQPLQRLFPSAPGRASKKATAIWPPPASIESSALSVSL
jgi:hypothetical protein